MIGVFAAVNVASLAWQAFQFAQSNAAAVPPQ